MDPSVQTYSAFEVLKHWTEQQATWNSAYIGGPWEVPGAWGASDKGSTIVAAIAANSANADHVARIALSRDLVQRWVQHPEQNHGVVFGNNSSYDGTSFASSDASAEYTRPTLLILKPSP
jgi:hypothetical protein